VDLWIWLVGCWLVGQLMGEGVVDLASWLLASWPVDG